MKTAKNTKQLDRLKKAMDSLHKMETYRLNTLRQQLEAEKHQMKELSDFLLTQQASVSRFADITLRSLSNAKQRVHVLEEEMRQQKVAVAQAELGSDRAKGKLRQVMRHEDEQKLEQRNEEHFARLHRARRASLR
ncbi:MAG: hypothetical protein AAF346_12635 [Pseudomonadota bacterium]